MRSALLVASRRSKRPNGSAGHGQGLLEREMNGKALRDLFDGKRLGEMVVQTSPAAISIAHHGSKEWILFLEGLVMGIL